MVFEPRLDLTRRTFLGTVTALCAVAEDSGWTPLFDGTLKGWHAGEHAASWRIAEEHLVAAGPSSHLFYAGPVAAAQFRNFELELECLTEPGCISGLYFHSTYQPAGAPKDGLKVQIANTPAAQGSFTDRSKTGSLVGIRNIYKQFAADKEWCKLRVAVRGPNVQVRLNDMLLVDYTEPATPLPPSLVPPLGRGKFALECQGGVPPVRFCAIRVRPLPDDLPAPAEPRPAVDSVYRDIVEFGRANIPMVDYHVHLKGGLTLGDALAKSRQVGIEYGLAVNCGKGFPTENDEAAARYVDSMRTQPAFIAMQAEGREWMQMFTRRAVSLFDYVFTDSMTWTDDRGLRRRLWLPDEVGAIPDAQEFMEILVRRTVGILEHEPIDIYVNPSYLPEQIKHDYDRLWTEERIAKVVTAAARNQVAIELNDLRHLPSPAFVRMAKSAGCKFTMGTNNTAPKDLGRSEYGLRIIRECNLGWQDFFVPGAWWPRAFDRKGDALRPA